MRILQVTNIVSPHQIPLAKCLARTVGESNFRFAVTELPNEERQSLGWDTDESAPWILRPRENADDLLTYNQWWVNADVVICDERLISKIEDRLASGLLTFYMSERWWKPPIGIARMLHPRFAIMALRFR